MEPGCNRRIKVFGYLQRNQVERVKLVQVVVSSGNADARTQKTVTSLNHQLTAVISELLVEEFLFSEYRNCDFW